MQIKTTFVQLTCLFSVCFIYFARPIKIKNITIKSHMFLGLLFLEVFFMRYPDAGVRVEVDVIVDEIITTKSTSLLKLVNTISNSR